MAKKHYVELHCVVSVMAESDAEAEALALELDTYDLTWEADALPYFPEEG